ncbi:MAG: lactonase family protein [Caldilineaceae bacterium]|nr:lactonase family protein [Caldilineaceae bacterium]
MEGNSLFIGSYTTTLGHVTGQGAGIYRVMFDPVTRALGEVTLAAELPNPSYLAYAPGLMRLYAVEESSPSGEPRIVAFAVSPDDELLELNSRPALGGAPCHALVDPAEKWLFVAYYAGAMAAVYPLAEGGLLGDAIEVIRLTGSGPNAARQEASHPHACVLDRLGNYLFVPDLGTDRIMVYRFDAETGKLSPLPPGLALPGAGPRHLAVHPDNRFLYVANELNATVTLYAHDEGNLTALQSFSTVPAGLSGDAAPAAVRLTHDGRFLYVSNRVRGATNGQYTLAAFAVDGENGALTNLGYYATGGVTPRDFIITDNSLLAANQDAHNLTAFSLDSVTGVLTPAGAPVSVPSPACLVQAV